MECLLVRGCSTRPFPSCLHIFAVGHCRFSHYMESISAPLDAGFFMKLIFTNKTNVTRGDLKSTCTLSLLDCYSWIPLIAMWISLSSSAEKLHRDHIVRDPSHPSHLRQGHHSPPSPGKPTNSLKILE